jgi:CRP-like cAMP-binding protein
MLDLRLETLPIAPGLADLFRGRGTLVRAGDRQPIVLETSRDEQLHLVVGGCLAVAAGLSVVENQILGLFYPGDVISSRFIAKLPMPEAVALGSAELLRISLDAAVAISQGGDWPARALLSETQALWARAAIHTIVVAQLSAEQRVVSFLIEIAARLGRFSGQGCEVVLPMGRGDIARYLALNADTLSRTLTRLKEAGVIEFQGRRDIAVASWQGLCSATPLAEMILALHRRPLTVASA